MFYPLQTSVDNNTAEQTQTKLKTSAQHRQQTIKNKQKTVSHLDVEHEIHKFINGTCGLDVARGAFNGLGCWSPCHVEDSEGIRLDSDVIFLTL